jgi:hypothetical protein
VCGCRACTAPSTHLSHTSAATCHTHTHTCTLANTTQAQGDKEKEIGDCKLIIQNIVYGAKTMLFSILYCTRHYDAAQLEAQREAQRAAAEAAGRAVPPGPPIQVQGGMLEDDVVACSELLASGLACLKVASFFGCAVCAVCAVCVCVCFGRGGVAGVAVGGRRAALTERPVLARHACHCLHAHTHARTSTVTHTRAHTHTHIHHARPHDIKELCEHFAECFTVMDARDFTDVFTVRMGVLYDAMAADPDILTVTSHLVQSSSMGRMFNALLAQYMTAHKLHLLAEPSGKVCACVCACVCVCVCVSWCCCACACVCRDCCCWQRPSCCLVLGAATIPDRPRPLLAHTLNARTHTHTHTRAPRLQDVVLIQKLYRLVFLGLTLPEGEALLVPSLVKLVRRCLDAATQEADPLAYLQLLRILFRHVQLAKVCACARACARACVCGGWGGVGWGGVGWRLRVC